MSEQRKTGGKPGATPVNREALVMRFMSDDGLFTAIDCALTSSARMLTPPADADRVLEAALLSATISSTLQAAGVRWMSPLDGVLLVNAEKTDDLTLIRVRDVQSDKGGLTVTAETTEGPLFDDPLLRPDGAKLKDIKTKPGMSLIEFATRIETAAEETANWQGDELYIVPVFCRVLSPMTTLMKDLSCNVWRQARVSLVPERTEPDWLAVTQVLLINGSRYPDVTGLRTSVIEEKYLAEAIRIDGRINPATVRARAMLDRASRGVLDQWFKHP